MRSVSVVDLGPLLVAHVMCSQGQFGGLILIIIGTHSIPAEVILIVIPHERWFVPGASLLCLY